MVHGKRARLGLGSELDRARGRRRRPRRPPPADRVSSRPTPESNGKPIHLMVDLKIASPDHVHAHASHLRVETTQLGNKSMVKSFVASSQLPNPLDTADMIETIQ